MNTTMTTRLFFLAGLTLLLSAALGLQVLYLLWGEWSFDQGHNLLLAKLIDHGYRPYSEIFMDRPPLFFWNIGPAYAFFKSVEGMQLLMVAYALLAIAALVSIGASLDGRLTGLLAGTLLAFNFAFFAFTRTVAPEIPALALALVSLALGLRYWLSGRPLWLGLSAAAMGGSLLVNYFMPWLMPLILLALVAPRRHRPAASLKIMARRGWLWSAIVAGIALLPWFAAGFRRVLDQAILFHLLKSAAAETASPNNLDLVWQAFNRSPLLSVSAVAGLILALVHFRRGGWLALGWFGLTLAFLLIYSPLRSKHLILFTPVLALLASLPIAALLRLWWRPTPARWPGGLAGAMLAALLAWELAAPFQALAKPKEPMIDEKIQPLADLLRQFTSPADCLITDDPYLAFAADRLTPPWLANLSYARFDSGVLDAPTMIDITETAGCQVVAPVLDRLKNANRPYYNWAKGRYVRTWVLAGYEIMLGQPLQHIQPQWPLNADFSGQVTLQGADWYPIENGGYLSLYWRPQQRFSQDYKIFVQLRNQAGQTVASADHEMYYGLAPTTLWPTGVTLKDTNRLTWPVDLPPGAYSLYVGLYDPTTLERLPITADASGENAVVISGIVIQD